MYFRRFQALIRIYQHHVPYGNPASLLHQDRTGAPDGGLQMSRVHKFKFTKTRLSDLPNASSRDRYFVYGTVVRGFCLMVTKSGFKSFYLNRTIDY